MADSQDEKMQLAVALNRVADRLDRLEKMDTTANSAQITVQAGGVGVWVATTCCLMMLGIVLVGSLWVSREFTNHDQQLIEIREENKTMQSYLNAIYQVAPTLKPAEDEK